MAQPEIDEFAKSLVRHVRDTAVRNCDELLRPEADSPVARKWRATGLGAAKLHRIVPDAVDEAIASLLQAIDQGLLRVKFVCNDGPEVDLSEDGMGELCGWYMGSGGWRDLFSDERHADDFADLST